MKRSKEEEKSRRKRCGKLFSNTYDRSVRRRGKKPAASEQRLYEFINEGDEVI